MFKSGTKSGDYHHEINFDNYERWLKTKLIPNLLPNSVLLINNAAYHNVRLNPAPTSSSRKSAMIDWLSDRDIPFSDRMCKPELYSLIKLRKRFKTFKIDALLAEHGHSAFHLPPHHPDLNPNELICVSIKEYVARKNVSFRLDDAMEPAEEKFNIVTKEEWSSRCNNVRRREQNYLRLEPITDDISEQIVIFLQNDSDNRSCSNSERDEEVAEEEDGELSEIEAL
jgi:transposase